LNVYFRTGLYKAPGLPFIAGMSGGEVVAVGPGVTNFHPGDPRRLIISRSVAMPRAGDPADKLVKLPPHYLLAAPSCAQGADGLYCCTRPSRSNPARVLIHAAAGVLGCWLQWAKGSGAHVIGTVAHKAKRSRALSMAASRHPLHEEDFVARSNKSAQRTLRCRLLTASARPLPGSLSSLRPAPVREFWQRLGSVPPFPSLSSTIPRLLFRDAARLNDYV